MKEKKTEKMELAPKSAETVNPFQMMRRFTKDMERLFDDFQGFSFPKYFNENFPEFRLELEKGEWVPQVEVLHNNGEFIVRADLPGLTKDAVKVELTGDVLMISGERKEEKEEKNEAFYRSERKYGSFYRQIPLPEGARTEDATATFENGVLEVTIPAAKVESSTRRLEINGPTEQKQVKAAA